MGSHKVSQVEFVVRTAYEQRASLFKTGDVFAGEVIKHTMGATVLVSSDPCVRPPNRRSCQPHAHHSHQLSRLNANTFSQRPG